MLDKEQIDTLFDFCRKHFVHHYDVQVELVDHLANAIEEKMALDKNVSFETALDKVYAGFGVFGFAGVVSAKSVSLEKQYRKLKWKLFLSYFTLPKAAFTVCIFLVLSLPVNFLSGKALSIFLIALIGLLFIWELYVSIKSIRKVRKQTRKLLMTYAGPQQVWFLSFALGQFIGFDFFNVLDGTKGVSIINFEVVIFIAVLVLVGIMAYRDVVNQLHELAKKQYPEAFV